QQADLDEDAFDVEPMQFTCAAILVRQTGDLAALAVHLGRLSRQDDSHVRQAAELALQDLVRPQTAVELDHRYVRDDAGQINRGLYAGVPAADHRHALALEQRAVAVRAVGNAAATVVAFARDIQLAPARTCGEHDRTAAQRRS